MDFTPYRFFDFGDVNLDSVDTFPFGDNEGKPFVECPLLDCCVLSHLFPCHLPKLYEYLESQRCVKLNSLYYPPDIIGFLNADFLTVHEKVRILEEIFYGSFSITPSTNFLTYHEGDNMEMGGIWSTAVAGFHSATPKRKRPNYLIYNKAFPHRYDVTGTKEVLSLPILFFFEHALWKTGSSRGKDYTFGVPVLNGEPIDIDGVTSIKVRDFEVSLNRADAVTMSTYDSPSLHAGYLRVLIKNFSVE